MPLFQKKQPHLAQALAVGNGFVGIFGRTHEHEVLFEKRDLGERGFRYGKRENGRVQPPLVQLGDKLRRQRLPHMNVEVVVLQRQPTDNGGQQIGCDGRDHPDPEPPGEPPLRRARQIAQFINTAKYLPRFRHEIFAERGQPQLARPTFDQRCPEFFFELLDPHRKGRLRNGAGIGRAPEVAVLREGVEIAELLDRQVCHNP